MRAKKIFDSVVFTQKDRGYFEADRHISRLFLSSLRYASNWKPEMKNYPPKTRTFNVTDLKMILTDYSLLIEFQEVIQSQENLWKIIGEIILALQTCIGKMTSLIIAPIAEE